MLWITALTSLPAGVSSIGSVMEISWTPRSSSMAWYTMLS